VCLVISSAAARERGSERAAITVTGVMITSSQSAPAAFTCHSSESEAQWTCEPVIFPDADCDKIRLEQLEWQEDDRVRSLRADEPVVAKIRDALLKDRCDVHPPVLHEVLLAATRISTPGTVKMSLRATDDDSGVASVSGHFQYQNYGNGTFAPRLYFSCKPADVAGMNWSCEVAIPFRAAKGVWQLQAVQLLDKANNLKLYTTKDPQVADVSFTVQ